MPIFFIIPLLQSHRNSEFPIHKLCTSVLLGTLQGVQLLFTAQPQVTVRSWGTEDPIIRVHWGNGKTYMAPLSKAMCNWCFLFPHSRQEQLEVGCLASGHTDRPRVESNQLPSSCQTTALTFWAIVFFSSTLKKTTGVEINRNGRRLSCDHSVLVPTPPSLRCASSVSAIEGEGALCNLGQAPVEDQQVPVLVYECLKISAVSCNTVAGKGH